MHLVFAIWRTDLLHSKQLFLQVSSVSFSPEPWSTVQQTAHLSLPSFKEGKYSQCVFVGETKLCLSVTFDFSGLLQRSVLCWVSLNQSVFLLRSTTARWQLIWLSHDTTMPPCVLSIGPSSLHLLPVHSFPPKDTYYNTVLLQQCDKIWHNIFTTKYRICLVKKEPALH